MRGGEGGGAKGTVAQQFRQVDECRFTRVIFGAALSPYILIGNNSLETFVNIPRRFSIQSQGIEG